MHIDFGQRHGAAFEMVFALFSHSVGSADTQQFLSLNSAQCRLLTAVNQVGSSLYQELTKPFNTNPNVKIDFLLAEMAIRFTGQRAAVESAHSHFKSQLQRHIPIEL